MAGLQIHLEVAAHQPSVIRSDAVRNAHPLAKAFLGEIVDKGCLAGCLTDTVDRVIHLLRRQLSFADEIIKGRENIGAGVRHSHHWICRVPVLFAVRTVGEGKIALLAEHHGFVDRVLFLRELDLILGADGTEALPLLVLGHRIFFPALRYDAAVAVAGALSFDHVVFQTRSIGTNSCGAVRAGLQRLGRGAAELGSHKIPVTYVEFLLRPIGAEVIHAAAHQQLVVAAVSDQAADEVAAHEGMHVQVLRIVLRIAGHHAIHISQTVVGVGAHGLAALHIVRYEDPESLHHCCSHDIAVTLGIVRAFPVGDDFVPGGFDRLDACVDLLGDTGVDFSAHNIFSFRIV